MHVRKLSPDPTVGIVFYCLWFCFLKDVILKDCSGEHGEGSRERSRREENTGGPAAPECSCPASPGCSGRCHWRPVWRRRELGWEQTPGATSTEQMQRPGPGQAGRVSGGAAPSEGRPIGLMWWEKTLAFSQHRLGIKDQPVESTSQENTETAGYRREEDVQGEPKRGSLKGASGANSGNVKLLQRERKTAVIWTSA